VTNTVQETIDTRYDMELDYDGRGQVVRERYLKYNSTSQRMETLQDTQTDYDLGHNPTSVKFYDNSGWAFTETRTYAKGYQLTGFSESHAAGVTVVTGINNYTYDTNNNMTGTKMLDVKRGSTQLAYRDEWTFTFDKMNRLKTYTNTNASNKRGNLSYRSNGTVWQRWQDNTSTSLWDATLKRFVYDGSQLTQEHDWTASGNGTWSYLYTDINRDYLGHPGGIRQREGTKASHDDYYMQLNSGVIEYKTERPPAPSIAAKEERTISLNQLPNSTFTNISNLATGNGYVEMYGGKAADTTAGFDGLMQRGGRHYLSGLDMFASRMGNGPYRRSIVGGSGLPSGGDVLPLEPPIGGGGGGLPVPPSPEPPKDPPYVPPGREPAPLPPGRSPTPVPGPSDPCDSEECQELLGCLIRVGGDNPLKDTCCPEGQGPIIGYCLTWFNLDCLPCFCGSGSRDEEGTVWWCACRYYDDYSSSDADYATVRKHCEEQWLIGPYCCTVGGVRGPDYIFDCMLYGGKLRETCHDIVYEWCLWYGRPHNPPWVRCVGIYSTHTDTERVCKDSICNDVTAQSTGCSRC